MKLILLVMLGTALMTAAEDLDERAESQATIDFVNNANTTWKAGRNFHPDFKKSQMLRLLGLKKDTNGRVLPVKEAAKSENPEDIPSSFDARTHWPHCPSIRHIPDQSACGSCWAVASAAAFTDRLCIASKGHFTAQLSSLELLSCETHDSGCEGGDDVHAWLYFKHHGIVTGGDYNSSEGCQPYPFQPCGTGSRIPCTELGNISTPQCQRTCTNKLYKTPFKQDHHKVAKAYSVDSSVEAIQREIMNHGPVSASFTVYEDFESYKSGVYHHTAGVMFDEHAVKIIGWGTEEDSDTPYWLVANSWNTDWGELGGFFKILRGRDECGFESGVNAGIPQLQAE